LVISIDTPSLIAQENARKEAERIEKEKKIEQERRQNEEEKREWYEQEQ
jgi:hypothetical protein